MEASSSRSLDSIGSGEYKCDCGLPAVVRTSFTYKNMGMRFRCCRKKTGQCQYFHFLPGEERIEGRARELLLIFKDKESRTMKEKDIIEKENGKLKLEIKKVMQENGGLMNENAKLLQESGKLLQENDQVKTQSGLMDKKIKVLEKKVKRVEMRSSQAALISQFVCLVVFIVMTVIMVLFVLRK